MAAYTFMKVLNDTIPEYPEWKENPLPNAIFAIEGLRRAIELTEVYYQYFIEHRNRNPDFEEQLALHWSSTVKSVGYIDKRLTSLCRMSRSRLLRADDWIKEVNQGFEPDFKSPYAKLGVLLNSAKGQDTRQRSI